MKIQDNLWLGMWIFLKIKPSLIFRSIWVLLLSFSWILYECIFYWSRRRSDDINVKRHEPEVHFIFSDLIENFIFATKGSSVA